MYLNLNSTIANPAAGTSGNVIDRTQILASVVWSRNVIVGNATGTAGATTNFNNNAEINIGGAVSPNNFTTDLTWQVILTKGTGTVTSAGLAALPGTVRAISLGNNSSRSIITLTGLNAIRLTNTTCTITANNTTLPAASTRTLNAAGRTAGDTPVNIMLSGCTQAGGAVTSGVNVRTYFDGASIDLASGRLNVDAGGVRNLQVQLLDNNGGAPSVINLAGASGNQGVRAVPITGGGAAMRFLARYYATAPVSGAGTIVTRVNYTIEYP